MLQRFGEVWRNEVEYQVRRKKDYLYFYGKYESGSNQKESIVKIPVSYFKK